VKVCAIYARVSTSEQNCELQVEELKEYAFRRGWKIEIILEEKISGTKSKRPKLDELKKLAVSRKIDIVLIWKLDRLFRSLKDLLIVLQDWSDLGIELCSLKDNVDMSTSSGRLLMHLIGAFAEFEAGLIKQRVQSGLENAKRNGVKLGRPCLQADSEKAKMLRATGKTIRQIAAELGIGNGSVQKLLKEGVRITFEKPTASVQPDHLQPSLENYVKST
jgi:DNA invertase Pin-like site-specific DNA recombinase